MNLNGRLVRAEAMFARVYTRGIGDALLQVYVVGDGPKEPLSVYLRRGLAHVAPGAEAAPGVTVARYIEMAEETERLSDEELLAATAEALNLAE